MIVCVVEITAEHDNDWRSLASRIFLLEAAAFSFVWREESAAELT